MISSAEMRAHSSSTPRPTVAVTQSSNGSTVTHSGTKEKHWEARGWDKYVAEMGYTLRGLHAFISELRAGYRCRHPSSLLVWDDDETASAAVAPDNCFFNLCERATVELAKQRVFEVGGAAAVETAVADGSLYRTLLATGACVAVDQLFSMLEDRDADTGWVLVTGMPGSGLSTMLHHLSYKWGDHEKLWHDRFDFVFYVKLSLLGVPGFWDGFQNSSTDSDDDTCMLRLAWLVYKSLEVWQVHMKKDGTRTHVDLETVALCLKSFSHHTLLLLDHFDEIQLLYRPSDQVQAVVLSDDEVNRHALVKQVVDFALTMPNGIVTSRDESISDAWAVARKVSRRFMLIGMSTDNVASYISNHFKFREESLLLDPTVRGEENHGICLSDVGHSLIEEVRHNPELMALAQTPVLAAALCLIWEDEVLFATALKLSSITLLYYRVVIWFGRRHCMKHKLKPGSDRPGFPRVLELCGRELSAFGKVAYEVFMGHKGQYIDYDVLLTHCYNDEALCSEVIRFGLLRVHQSRLNSSTNEGKVFFFIHITYLEFFVAYRILELFRMNAAIPYGPGGNEVSALRAELQEAIRLVIIDPHPRNALIRRFLSGLLSMPPVAYAAIQGPTTTATNLDNGAALFWDACMDVCAPVLCTCIGLKPEVRGLRRHTTLLREALLTSESFRHALHTGEGGHLEEATRNRSSSVPASVWEHEQKVHCVALWQDVCSMPELMGIFDFAIAVNKETQTARQQHMANRQQQLSDRKRFNLPAAPELSVGALLAGLTSFSESLHRIHEQTKSVDDEDRVAAAEALGDVCASDAGSVSALCALLDDSYWDVRRAAAVAVGRCVRTPPPGLLRKLRDLLDDVYAVQLAAAEALGHVLYRHPDPREEAQLYLTSLQGFVQSKDWLVRSASIDALSRIRANDDITVGLLIGAVGDTSEYVQRSAMHALGRLYKDNELNPKGSGSGLSPDDVVACIRHQLHSSNKRVRTAAAKTLHAMRCADKLTREVLKHCDTDHSYIYNLTAKDIKSFAALRNAAVKDMDKEVRLAAADALHRLVCGDEATLAALRADMKRKDWHVRVSATEALSRMEARDEHSQRALCDNLVGDRQIEVKLAAAAALKHIAEHLNSISVAVILDYVTEALPNDLKSGKYLQISQELHVALLRLTPLQYAVLFALKPEQLTNRLACEAFVISIWTHSTTVLIESEKEMLLVDGRQVSLTGTPAELEAFAATLRSIQRSLIDTIARHSSVADHRDRGGRDTSSPSDHSAGEWVALDACMQALCGVADGVSGVVLGGVSPQRYVTPTARFL